MVLSTRRLHSVRLIATGIAALGMAAALILGLGPAAAAGALRCPRPANDLDDEQQCGALVVPLDRAAADSPEVAVRVARVRTQPPRATPVLELTGDDQTADPVDAGISLDPILQGQGRDLYVMADRVAVVARRCARDPYDRPEAGTRCAAALGAARRHLTPVDTAQDAAAVVEALGLPRVVVFATGGGAEAGIRFAAAHPERVERLIVDAPRLGEASDPLRRWTLEAALGIVRDACVDAWCGRFDVDGALRAAATPGATVSAADLARVVLDGPFERLPAVPAALTAAARGDDALLRRLVGAVRPGVREPWDVVRACASAWPWDAGAPPADRLASLAATTAEPLPATALLATATVTQACAGWPDADGSGALPAPTVPTLITVGAWDRGGTAGAARWLRAQLPAAAMTILSRRDQGIAANTPSTCGDVVLRRFLGGRAVPATCAPGQVGPRDVRELEAFQDILPAPVPVPPASLRDLRPARAAGSGRAGRVLAAVLATLTDAFAEQRLADDTSATFSGLRGGRVRQLGTGLVLRDVAYVPGVVVSGRLLRGGKVVDVTVRGPGAGSGGRLVVGLRLRASGRIDGRRIRGRLADHADDGLVLLPR